MTKIFRNHIKLLMVEAEKPQNLVTSLHFEAYPRTIFNNDSFDSPFFAYHPGLYRLTNNYFNSGVSWK